MPLLNDAVPGTLADLYRANGYNLQTASVWEMGSTSQPAGHRVTSWGLMAKKTQRDPGFDQRMRLNLRLGHEPPKHIRGHYEARFTIIQGCDPGSNTSVYVKKGVYESNYGFPDDPNDLPHGWKQNMEQHIRPYRSEEMRRQLGYDEPRVYFYVSDEIANRSHLAENEHLTDHRAAFDMSLGLFEQILRVASCTGMTEAEARDGAVQAVLDALPNALRGYGVVPQRWRELYETLFEKSRKRDDDGDHSFGLEYMEEDEVEQIENVPIHYLTGAQRVEPSRTYVKVTAGASRVPGPSTQQIVRYPQ